MKFIKQISATLLLAIYLVAAPATSELLKFPLLVKHFYQHKAGNHQIGFISFLKMHYKSSGKNKHYSKENNRLPFKTAHNISLETLLSLTPPLFILSPIKNAVIKNRIFPMQNQWHLPSKHLAAIWQPPRNN